MDPPAVGDVALGTPPAELAGPQMAAAKGEWSSVLERLEALKRDIQRGPVDVKVHAEVLAARAHLAAGEAPQATAAYRKAVNGFNGAAKKLNNQLTAMDKSSQYEVRLATMMQNFGEALFFLAEDKRAKLDAIVPPPYEGPANEAQVARHFDKKIDRFSKQWVQTMDKAMKEYLRVEALEPAPKVWVVAAAARKAQMLEAHHDRLVGLQAPGGWASAAPAPAAGAAPAGAAAPAGSASAAPSAASPSAASPSAAPPPEAAALKVFEARKAQAVEAARASTKEAFQACADAAGGQDSVFARYCLAWLGKPLPSTPLPQPAAPPAPPTAPPATPSAAASAAAP